MDEKKKNGQEEKIDRRSAIKRIAKTSLALGGVLFLPSLPALAHGYVGGYTNDDGEGRIGGKWRF